MIDPRFRRRRVEVRRQEGLRRFRALVGLSLVVTVGCAGWAATDSSLLDLDSVVIEGAVHASPDEARLASGLQRGQPLLDIDRVGAARGVSSLPWVERATVVPHWSGKVRIRLVERRPMAVIASGAGSTALVDGSGRVLEWVGAAPPDLAVLTGLPAAGPAGTTLVPEGGAALAVAVALPAELRASTVDVAPASDGRGEVDLRLRPQGTVRIGPAVDLERKFDAIRAVLTQVDVRSLAVLDVRRPDSPVLTRVETPTKVRPQG